MVFGTGPHIERARAHLQSDDRHRLLYACLELRFALERIAYQKLQLRLDKVTVEEIAAWQPRRAMDRLMELVDEHLMKDSVLRVAVEEEHGVAPEDGYLTVGATKGVSPREIGKHWQKISSYLHVRMPKTKGDKSREPDEAKLRLYLHEVIEYVEEVTKTSFDSHFSLNVTFTCKQCNQSVVRNRALLKDGDVVQCQNPNCIASYITNIENENFNFELYQIPIHCKECGENGYVDANEFRMMKTDEGKYYVCNVCGARYLVRWLLKYALDPEVDEGEKSGNEY